MTLRAGILLLFLLIVALFAAASVQADESGSGWTVVQPGESITCKSASGCVILTVPAMAVFLGAAEAHGAEQGCRRGA